MSIPAAKRTERPAQPEIGFVPGPMTGRLALSLGAASLPLGAFGMINGSWPVLSIAALAAGVAAFTYTRVIFSAGKAHIGRVKSRADAFQHLVEHVRDGVMQFDPQGNLTLVSRSAHELFGCQKYELTGDGLAERAHVLDRPLYMTAMADARLDGTDRLIEVRMRRDNAAAGRSAPEYIWVEINLSPVRDAGEGRSPYGVIALMRDISRRKEGESQMIAAQKAAEDASVAKSQFLAVIGHELRTPLNAIVGFSDMMANGIGGKLEPAHEEYAKLISQSGHHLLEVVNMLLDMSKIEAGRFELQTAKFEPESLVAPCIQMVSKAAREKNIEVEVKLGKNLPEIMGDERACRQILINLLSNAIKFSEAGNSVTWSMKRQGQSLNLTITDNGIGMSKEVLARVGEPFFQAQSNVDRRYEGTGLGMSIVKGLVDLHEGTIKVNSETGRGTTVAVSLPIDGPQGRNKTDDGVTTLPAAQETDRNNETDTTSEPWQEPKRLAR